MSQNQSDKQDKKYTPTQIRGRINQFADSMHTIKTRGHSWDYFAQDYKEIRFPDEPSPLTGGKMMDAFVHYNEEKEQIGVRVSLYLENEEDVIYLLKRINKVLTIFEANKINQETRIDQMKNPS
jgi:hypothetical protein